MKKYSLIFFLLGLVGLAIMVIKTDFSEIDWSITLVVLPVILLIWAVIYAIHILSYRLVIGRTEQKISLGFLIRMTLSGFALNAVTPVGLIGGEPYRIAELKPRLGLKEAVSTTLSFTFMHVITHIMFLFSGAALYFLLGAPGNTVAAVFSVLVLLILGTVIVLFFIAGCRPVVGPTLNFLCRIPLVKRPMTKMVEKNRQAIADIDASVMAFRTRKHDFWVTLVLEFGARVLEAGEFFVLFRLLETPVSFLYVCMAFSFASLLGNLLFLVPMQVGTREGALLLAMNWIDVESHVCVTASLLARLREIIFLVIGVICILIGSKKQKKV